MEILIGHSDPHHRDVDAGEGDARHDVLEGGEDVDQAELDAVPLRGGGGRGRGGRAGGEIRQHGQEHLEETGFSPGPVMVVADQPPTYQPILTELMPLEGPMTI